MGFTLIELILVMAIFTIIFAIVSPDLSHFFRGRNLDNEAQQFLSLTRFGRSRAIGEGVPVELWINAKQGTYGLEAVSGYTETSANAKSLTYTVDPSLRISTSVPQATLGQSNYWSQAKTFTRGLPMIRFQPDGHISDTSPREIYFQQNDHEVWLAEDLSHLRYELQTGPAKH
jgi:type II secretion system protein H